MKKIYITALALLLVLSTVFVSPVFAQEGSDKKDDNKGGLFQGLKNIIRNDDNRNNNGIGSFVRDMRHSDNDKNDDINKNGFVVYGTVTAVSGSTLTVTDKLNNANVYTINTANAKMSENGSTITISSIVNGDVVVVEGTRDGNTVTATSVRVGAMLNADTKDRNESHLVGTVTAVSGQTITFSVKNSNGTTTIYTVNATNAKIVKNGSTSSVSNIVVGDMIKVEGTLNGTTLTATEIKVGTKTGMNNFIFEGNGQPIIGGTVTAINGSSLTMTNKSNVSYTIDASSAKVMANASSSTYSNIKVGDSILVQGAINGSTIVASSINDQGQVSTDTNTQGGILVRIRNFFSRLFGF